MAMSPILENFKVEFATTKEDIHALLEKVGEIPSKYDDDLEIMIVTSSLELLAAGTSKTISSGISVRNILTLESVIETVPFKKEETGMSTLEGHFSIDKLQNGMSLLYR